jgi:hypothetical protein
MPVVGACLPRGRSCRLHAFRQVPDE